METKSLWEGTAPEGAFPKFAGEWHADVVVVGGGITGITAAQLLSAAGKGVAVLEARTVGAGTTGYSTGNLHATLDDGLRSVAAKWGAEVARAVARSRMEMIEHIESTVAQYGLTCRYARRPHFIFALDEKQARQLQEEHDALQEAGLSVMFVNASPAGDDVVPSTELSAPGSQVRGAEADGSDESGPVAPVDRNLAPEGLVGPSRLPASIGAVRALRINNQAQFQPLAYTRLLASALQRDTCRVFEWSPAVEIDSDKGIVRTPDGVIYAQHIILATHTPKGFNLLQTDLGPYREYGIAARLAGADGGPAADDAYPTGIFWSLAEPSHSIRSFEMDGTRYLVVIGEKHKTGQHDDATDYYAAVEAYLRQHFNVSEIAYRWSGQHYRPADGLPYIGKTLNSGRAFVATGYGTNGLLYGPVAARIIVDEILGRANPYAGVYAAKRFTPVKSAGDFLKENLNVGKQYARDWLTGSDATPVDELTSLPPDEGQLVDVNRKKVAVYRRASGEVVMLSAACTHLGCIVHWNAAEKSWDCPCHGSRFACTGEVLEGPALEPLKRLNDADAPAPTGANG